MMDHTAGMEKQIRTLNKRSLFTLFLTWLALFFTVIGIAAGYKNFLRVHDKAKQASHDAKVAKDIVPELARKGDVQSWQEQILEQVKVSSQKNTLELMELKNVSNTSAYIADTLGEQVRQLTIQQETLQSPQKYTNQWKAEEVRYLLRTALLKIQLDEDVRGAEKALKLADRLLIEMGVSEYLVVRQAIAADIALLSGISSSDQSELVRSIDEVSAELKSLMEAEATANSQSQGLIDTSGGRNSLLSKFQDSISHVVVVRQYDQALAKRISGDVDSVRLELLLLKLENLKLLGLRKQAEAYSLQLKEVRQILQQEQVIKSNEGLLKILKSLEGLVAIPDLPALKSPALMDSVLSRQGTVGADK